MSLCAKALITITPISLISIGLSIRASAPQWGEPRNISTLGQSTTFQETHPISGEGSCWIRCSEILPESCWCVYYCNIWFLQVLCELHPSVSVSSEALSGGRTCRPAAQVWHLQFKPGRSASTVSHSFIHAQQVPFTGENLLWKETEIPHTFKTIGTHRSHQSMAGSKPTTASLTLLGSLSP